METLTVNMDKAKQSTIKRWFEDGNRHNLSYAELILIEAYESQVLTTKEVE